MWSRLDIYSLHIDLCLIRDSEPDDAVVNTAISFTYHSLTYHAFTEHSTKHPHITQSLMVNAVCPNPNACNILHSGNTVQPSMNQKSGVPCNSSMSTFYNMNGQSHEDIGSIPTNEGIWKRCRCTSFVPVSVTYGTGMTYRRPSVLKSAWQGRLGLTQRVEAHGRQWSADQPSEYP